MEMAKTAQTLMNVQMSKQTNVIQTPCVPTLKDLMSAAVLEDMKEMVKTAQQLRRWFVIHRVE